MHSLIFICIAFSWFKKKLNKLSFLKFPANKKIITDARDISRNKKIISSLAHFNKTQCEFVKMAGLINLSKFAAKIANKNSLGVVIRTASHWNKDWKPGPYPTTQAEREAAAKKYGIPIEQYEPYENDGMGFGDYPKMPNISVDRKDPHYPYDYPEYRRNFNETLHVDVDVYSEDRHNNCKLNKKKIIDNITQ